MWTELEGENGRPVFDAPITQLVDKMDHLEYSVPKQIGRSQIYTQTIWDEKNKKGYIALLTKKSDGTFETKSTDSTKLSFDQLMTFFGPKNADMD